MHVKLSLFCFTVFFVNKVYGVFYFSEMCRIYGTSKCTKTRYRLGAELRCFPRPSYPLAGLRRATRRSDREWKRRRKEKGKEREGGRSLNPPCEILHTLLVKSGTTLVPSSQCEELRCSLFSGTNRRSRDFAKYFVNCVFYFSKKRRSRIYRNKSNSWKVTLIRRRRSWRRRQQSSKTQRKNLAKYFYINTITISVTMDVAYFSSVCS